MESFGSYEPAEHRHYDPDRAPSKQSKYLALGLATFVRPLLQAAVANTQGLRAGRAVIDRAAAMQPIAKGMTESKLRTSTVSGLWLTNTKHAASGRVILYLHGGGFVACSPHTHKGMVSALARASKASAFLVDYRLAPENPYPAGADDCLAAYQMLLARGYDPTLITLAGDSAGGHLVSRLLADLDERNLPMPAGALLLSPFLDMTAKHSKLREQNVRKDPFVWSGGAEFAGRAYSGRLRPNDRRLDVIGRDKRRWPPILIQVGDTECLLPDSERMAESLFNNGVPVELQVWPGQVHVWHLFGGLVPESLAALTEAGDFLYHATAYAGRAQTA